MAVDETVLPIARQLLDCLCAEVALLADPPQQCCLRAGEVVSLNVSVNDDECCRGLAWVRLVSAFPSSGGFPEADGPLNCPPQWLAVVLEMGVARCSPVGDAYTYPSCEEWTDFTEKVMDDARAMRRAFCCLAVADSEKIMGVWEPLASEGRCGGGTLVVTVNVPICDNC